MGRIQYGTAQHGPAYINQNAQHNQVNIYKTIYTRKQSGKKMTNRHLQSDFDLRCCHPFISLFRMNVFG